MDYIEIIVLLVASLGGAAVFYKSKAEKSQTDAIMGETRGEDKILKENQDEVRKQISAADDTIKELYEERDRLRSEYESKTRQEKADEWNKKND